MRSYTVDIFGGNDGMKRLCIHKKAFLKKATKMYTPEWYEAKAMIEKGLYFVDATNFSMEAFRKHQKNPYFGQALPRVNIPL